MKNIQTASHRFIAVRLDTTGRLERKPFEVVKKLSIVVTPSMVLAGTAFHSNQNVRKDELTRIIPGMNTVVT
jgi:hypothetical protein